MSEAQAPAAFLEVPATSCLGGDGRRYWAILSSLLDPLVVMQSVRDAAGRIVDLTYTDANPAACEFIGIDRCHLVGRRLRDVYPEFAATGLLERYAATAVTGRPTIIDEYPFPLRSGMRWLEIRAVQVDGEICIGWRDVSKRHGEAERLAASEEQFRLLAENAMDVVVRFGPDDRVLWISPSVEGVLGWAVDGCIGRNALDFIATHESRERYIDSKKRVAAGLRAVVRVQLVDAGGQPHWAEVRSSPFRASDGSISGMVSTTRIIDTEVRAEEALERRARTDDLTGLFSRTEVMEQLDQLVTHASGETAVLWCDIDRFKVINDIHGHVVGDTVLRTLAARAMACGAAAGLMVGRVGGDEMMAVVPDIRELRDACMVAEELRRRAADPIPLANGVVRTTLSIGVTLASPGEHIDAILNRADDAMYRAKSGGRNRVVAVPPPAIPRPR